MKEYKIEKHLGKDSHIDSESFSFYHQGRAGTQKRHNHFYKFIMKELTFITKKLIMHHPSSSTRPQNSRLANPRPKNHLKHSTVKCYARIDNDSNIMEWTNILILRAYETRRMKT